MRRKQINVTHSQRENVMGQEYIQQTSKSSPTQLDK